jgi:hypothetical protein
VSSGLSKFFIDLKSSLKKRFLQIVRDKKSFVLEIICPIILVLIGCGVSAVQFVKNSPPELTEIQNISTKDMMINTLTFDNSIVPNLFYTSADPNITFQPVQFNSTSDPQQNIIGFNDLIENYNYTDNYGSYYFISIDPTNNNYKFIVYVNTQAKDGPITYTQFMVNNILNHAAGKTINVNV